MKVRRWIAVSFLSLGLVAAAIVPASATVDPALLAGMKARAIGPAAMSGRIGDIAAVERDPDTIYVGAATGGLWKSTSGGLTWTPIFDDQPVAAIGAVAIFQPNPDIVWVGTGEGNLRNSVSVGNGVYKSTDAGQTWRHLGLDKTERIHRILLHPRHPQIAWVAALGTSWGENEERGVFKTTDGGASWKKVLYVDARTGAADLALDPSNPDKLIAAMWEHRRWPWFFKSGGPGSGLYLSRDGGNGWTRLSEDEGLPAGELGRMGVAFCRQHPEVVYAIVEAERSAMLRSKDGGKSWTQVNADPDVAQRPFYYADIRVDPVWPNRVYNLGSRMRVSNDSGATFQRLGETGRIHGDYQALWINPNDPTHLLVGNDGGLAISHDRGETWRFVSNLPFAQFYHVAVDLDVPYNVYGGLQDNGSWRGPSAVRTGGGIPNHRWVRVGFGDGFDTQPDPQNSRRGYSMWQGGNLLRWDLDAGSIKPIRPPQPGEEELRFNWNAGLGLDPFDSATLYYGSQYLHRSTDRGATWTVVSPDLTTDEPEWQKQAESGGLTPDVTGAENYTTIIAVAPSAVEQGVIWVGTDDGRLHVTRNGGESWTSVEGAVPDVPAHTWIPHIAPSHFEGGEAFVVFDDHRRANWTPYVYRTRDYGASWQSLASEDLWGYALSIVQDPVDRDLLFLGTEFGLYVSRDGGGSWLRYTHGVPTVSVMDLALHPRDHDLVLGTHGRGVFVLDDVSPLRTLDEAVNADPLHLFPIPNATQYRGEFEADNDDLGSGAFAGENRPYGAVITYWLNDERLPHPDAEVERARRAARRAAGEVEDEEKGEEAPKAEGRRRGGPRGGRGGGSHGGGADEPTVEIRIADADGETVRTFEGPAKQGLNRAVWDFGRDPATRPPGAERSFFDRGSGPALPPGSYAVTVAHNEHEAMGTVTVAAAPEIGLDAAGWAAREHFIRRTMTLQETLATAVGRIVDARRDIDIVLRMATEAAEDSGDDAAEGRDAVAEVGDEGEAEAATPHEALMKSGRTLQERLDELEGQFREPPGTRGIIRRAHLSWDIRYALMSGTAGWSAPTPTDLSYLERAVTKLETSLETLNHFFAEDLASFREAWRGAGLVLLPPAAPVTVEAKP